MRERYAIERDMDDPHADHSVEALVKIGLAASPMPTTDRLMPLPRGGIGRDQSLSPCAGVGAQLCGRYQT